MKQILFMKKKLLRFINVSVQEIVVWNYKNFQHHFALCGVK